MKLNRLAYIAVLAILLVAASSIAASASHPGWVNNDVLWYKFDSNGNVISITQTTVSSPEGTAFIGERSGMITCSNIYYETLWYGTSQDFWS